jgi:hypothetical protein
VAIERNDSEERQARLDAMIEEFRAARQRHLVKAELVQWNQAATDKRAMACVKAVPRDQIH